MRNAAQPLIDMQKTTEFLVCIDSDGCVFDTMEVKHKECFTPNFINYFNLQSVSKYAREAWEYVNLYSKSRGTNRFPALVETLELLSLRHEVKKRGYKLPDLAPLKNWIAGETKLGNPALEAYVAAGHKEEILQETLAWSTAVNDTVASLVRGVPPFPCVVESLQKMQGRADVIIVSQTPNDALVREWKEHGIDRYVRVIAGQEMGTKAECIAFAKAHGYADDHVLMIGDAPGDYNAAKQNQALFFPINPGSEERAWQQFLDEAFDKFTSLQYKGAYQDGLIAAFDACLPDTPPWETK